MTAAPRLLVRADAGARIGLGHLARGAALARAWAATTGPATLLTTDTGADAFPDLRDGTLDLRTAPATLADPLGVAETLAVAAAVRPAWAVLDAPRLPRLLQRQLKQHGVRVAVIDDGEPGRDIDADCLVNPNADGPGVAYGPAVQAPLRLLGLAYLPLRPTVPVPAVVADVGLTFGGADPDDAAARAARALRVLDPGLRVAAVVGPAYQGLLQPEPGLLVFQRPSHPASLLRGCDVVVAAVGVTLLELLREGAAVLACARTPAQLREAEALVRAGALGGALHVDELGVALPAAVAQLRADPARRAALGAAGRHLVDGEGAARVVRELTAVLAAAEAR